MSSSNPQSDPNVSFFIRESLKLARQMPVPDCRAYLAGMLLLIGDSPEADDIRRATIHLDESDRQLELLSNPIV